MKKRVLSIIFMFLLTLILTSVVTAVKIANEKRIEVNEQTKLQKVILEVLNIPLSAETKQKDLLTIFEQKVTIDSLSDRPLYIAHDPLLGVPQAYAFAVSGPGFWGPIYAMVAIDAQAEKITAINFYRNQETPGLGARITEKWFQNQFAGIPLKEGKKDYFSLKDSAHNQDLVKLDAITGATQTSRAVSRFLNSELSRVMKKLKNK